MRMILFTVIYSSDKVTDFELVLTLKNRVKEFHCTSIKKSINEVWIWIRSLIDAD